MIVVALAVVGGLVIAVKALAGSSKNNPATSQVQLATPISTKSVNKELTIPIKDGKDTTLATIVYSVQDAQLTNEIIVQGVKKTSVQGRRFLILNLKLANDSTKKIQIDTRDYIRLSINQNDQELLAPDIHNDPVEVQALSTKFTRLGFITNTSDKNLVLKIGEINGNKTSVDLNF
jgi:hypothetical protein